MDTFNREAFPEYLLGQSVTGMFSELRLTSGRHAKVLFAPQKSVERVHQKIASEQGEGRKVLDYLRATIVMADPALLSMFYRALQLTLTFWSRKCLETLDQPPNVHANLEFRVILVKFS